MRLVKSLIGVIGALVPVLYCGGLVYYFVDLTGSPEEAQRQGLGPTVLGLCAIGLLFSVPLILKIVRLAAGPPSPGSSGPDDGRGGERGFDADAVIARYLANQAAQTPPSNHPGDGPAGTRPRFSRKSS